MPTTYLTPGVYVEEVPSANKPIEGVGTAIAAFIGMTPGGPINKPMRISNWTQFAKIFGDPDNPDNGPFMEGAFLAHAVYGFFQNGGQLAWIIRVGKEEKAPAPRAALPSAADKEIEVLRAVALEGVRDDVKVEVNEEPGNEGKEPGDVTYTVIVTSGPDREEYPGVTLKARARTNVATKVNAASKLIKIEETGSALPESRLAAGTYTLSTPSVAMEKIDAGDFEGDVATRKGIGGVSALDEVTMLVMPDIVNLDGDGAEMRDLQGKMIAHCEINGRMAILDAPDGLLPQDVLDWRMNVAGYDSKMAALYYPWIEVMNPLTRRPMRMPPSGHIAGVWSRVDSTRGVHKAPANEVILGANGVGFQVASAEQGELNRVGINCIRSFPGRGIRIWGARTLSSDPEWRYINVRRLFNYVSASIMAGTQWSVFEPNDQRLWSALTINIWSFLSRVYRSGALFGANESEAFFVKCDAETNPPEVVEAGQVVCEIGISPVKPAEFVIFRLSQMSGGGGAEVSE